MRDGSSGARWLDDSRRRMAACCWFAVQAVATLAWWLLMAASDRARGWFELSHDRNVLSSFVLADLVLIVGGSLIAALASWRRSRWAGSAAVAAAAAVAYATLYLVAWMVNGGNGWPGLVAMAAATLGSAAAAQMAAQAAMPGEHAPPATRRS